MLKSFLLSLSFLLILLSSCDVNPSPVQETPIPALSELPPITTKTPKSSGSMTNQAIEDIVPASVNKDYQVDSKKLLGYVQAAIIPTYEDWVVFENATYIVFDNIDTIPDIQKAALQHLETYRPKTPAEANWVFTISDLDKTEGWSVYGNGHGIYTFVHPEELTKDANPQQVAVYAKTKRALDERNPKILFISSKNGIQKIQ
jgi:hypothetical protein